MPGEVKFCKNKKTYVGNFLVCTNIGYDCVLGWDFLVHNNLDLRGETLMIQGRCEMTVPGRLAKSPTHNIGMISPIHRDKKAPHQSLNGYVVNAVVRPDGHSVPIRILNVLDKPIELCQG